MHMRWSRGTGSTPTGTRAFCIEQAAIDNEANPMSGFAFTVSVQDGAARAGTISNPRGTIRTPAFMPVGTAGTVKAM